MPIITELPINSNNDDEHYEELVTRQTRNNKIYDMSSNYDSFSIGSTLAVQQEDGWWTYRTVAGRGNYNHSNRSCMIIISKTCWVVTRNNKHIKAIPVTAEQYLMDQINKNTAEPLDDILKHCEKPANKNMTSIHESWGRKDTYINNNNGTQHSNMQEHIVNRIPASCEQEENQKQIPIHRNIGKPDERAITQSKKCNRLTYH